MTISTSSLEQKIQTTVEQLMREHLAACETAVAAAVREGLRRAAESSGGRRGAKTSRRRAPSQRRSREHLAQLERRLYEAVCAQPGETMVVLAKAVGASSRELSRPAMRLRHQGRIRSAGQRQYTLLPDGRVARSGRRDERWSRLALGSRARRAPACAACARWSSSSRRTGRHARSGSQTSGVATARRLGVRARRGCSSALTTPRNDPVSEA